VSAWILIAVSAAVLYGLWMLLDFTFTQIDNYHAARREERDHRAAEPRNAGAKRSGEKVG
jgi:hypothetical protein